MASIASELRDLRLKVEALQVEVAGRQSVDSMVVWVGQNLSSVNPKSDAMAENFSGLIVHLTPDLSQPEGTANDVGLSENDFNELKKAIARSLD